MVWTMKKRTRPRHLGKTRLVLPQLLLLLVLACLSYSPKAHAYTWMIRHGYTACATCHADPSGGELLTRYGRVTADMILRMQYGERPPDAKEPSPGVLWGLWDPPKNVLLSGSFRNLSVLRPSEGEAFKYVPVMQADLYGQVKVGVLRFGGTLGLARAPSAHGRPAQITTNDDGINLISRTHYVGVDLGEKFLLRAGRLNLPFGIRMPEHTTWVRAATRTDRDSDQQHGVAISYVGECLRGELMGIAGNYQMGPDAFRERGYSFFAEGIAGTSFGSGISSKVTYADQDFETLEREVVRQAHGVFARWTPFHQLVLMLEADALFRSRAEGGYAGFLQADYEAVTGLHFMVTGEILDQGVSISNDDVTSPGLGEPKVGAWLSADWFFYKQAEFRLDAIFRQEEPFTLLGQLHLYL